MTAMNILYASDDGFCRHLAVSIFSLIEHNRGEALCFHILSDGIGEKNRELLQQMVEDEGKEIRFYPLSDLDAQLRSRVYGMDTGRFRSTILARLLMGSLLPETVTKLLYIDADTVVLRPIHKLYALPLGEHIGAMAAEPTIYPEVKRFLGLEETEPYFNSGVFLVNLSRWREEKLEEDCFSYYNRVGGRLPFADQDILNAVLRGRILRLPQRFNFFSNYYYFRYSTLCGMACWYGESETRESFFVAKHHPVIAHFAGVERPWIRGNRNHYRRAYRLYLSRTPYAGAKPERGKRLAMCAYHMMNLLTFLRPDIRKLLSELYYRRYIRRLLER